jgi:hypothetical protein
MHRVYIQITTRHDFDRPCVEVYKDDQKAINEGKEILAEFAKENEVGIVEDKGPHVNSMLWKSYCDKPVVNGGTGPYCLVEVEERSIW